MDALTRLGNATSDHVHDSDKWKCDGPAFAHVCINLVFCADNSKEMWPFVLYEPWHLEEEWRYIYAYEVHTQESNEPLTLYVSYSPTQVQYDILDMCLLCAKYINMCLLCAKYYFAYRG